MNRVSPSSSVNVVGRAMHEPALNRVQDLCNDCETDSNVHAEHRGCLCRVGGATLVARLLYPLCLPPYDYSCLPALCAPFARWLMLMLETPRDYSNKITFVLASKS
jgi:hypothetical protein